MKKNLRNFYLAGTLFALVVAARAGNCTSTLSNPDDSWQRVTAHINGVFSPRGYFNLLVGLYSLPTLKSAQFNLGSSTIVLDFPPQSPTVTEEEIQHIEKLAGYRPGAVSIAWIPAHSFAESGPGWIKIKHPKSKNIVVRWFKQNF